MSDHLTDAVGTTGGKVTLETTRETLVERTRREVAEQVKASHDAMHRALDKKYNLLRVSERRWAIVRWGSVATVYFGNADVITFERVTKPLKFDEAIAELKRRRDGR